VRRILVVIVGLLALLLVVAPARAKNLIYCEMPVELENGTTELQRFNTDADTCYKYGGRVLGPAKVTRKDCGTITVSKLRYPATLSVKARGVSCKTARAVARDGWRGARRSHGLRRTDYVDSITDDLGPCVDSPGGCDQGPVEWDYRTTWRGPGGKEVIVTGSLD
jgi:hypothetical protein